MALSVNVSPTDVATGVYSNVNLGAGYTTSGNGWTNNGSGSQAGTGAPVTASNTNPE